MGPSPDTALRADGCFTDPDHQEQAGCNEHSAPRTRVRRFTVELGCLLCSRELGTFDSLTWPVHGPIVLVRTGGPKMLVADWHRLRCDNCGGSVLPVEITIEDDRVEAPHDWSEERPRRGRPPKQLADQRSDSGSAA
jgi:hypothetical protein